jgi:hypothetical protein
MFLRGAGSGNGKVGPAVKNVQQDSFKTHSHGVNINTNADGAHSHTTTFYNDDYNNAGSSTGTGLIKDGGNGYTRPTSTEPNHSHNVNGNSASTGDTETRPINYGVNYIIKI